jgi:WD40 repeat protein
LAYVGQTNTDTGAISSELFGIRPEDESPTQWTQLTANYGPVRINGHSIGDLSWSPDSTRVAFWVIAGEGDGVATIHLYDVRDGTLSRYCGFTTTEHNPNPPRLVWSPGGTHIAFGGNVPNDDKGYLLLALNTNDGNFIELSNGVYPALGSADVIAWGIQ